LVLENAGAGDETDPSSRGPSGSGQVQKSIRLMQERSLAEIIADSEIQAEYGRLYENYLRNIDVIRKERSGKGGVIFLIW
jgi:hypothetical protein